MTARPSAIPELGPLLGRLAAPADAGAPIPLDDVRLALVTELFELAGAARDFDAEGDHASALQSLNRHGWLAAWDRAVQAAAARVTERLDHRFRSAAAESRLPRRKLARMLLTAEERRGVAVRLGAGGATLVEALDEMEQAMRATARDDSKEEAWRNALTGVARRVEGAWLALEQAARDEELAWQPDIADVRAWRRPRWPLWLITAGVLALFAWLGLVLGGFVDSPRWFLPAADWWWTRT